MSDAPENPELSIPAGVCDEAVEALARVLFDREWVPGDWRWEQYPQPNRWQELARKGLEASAPLLGTRPQPTLDRNRLFNILVEFIMAQPQRADVVEYDGVLDQIMALAGRPLPTREQVDKLVSDWFRATLSPEVRDMLADAVLALMGGAE